ncbi:hypothetical protein DFH09DRAFT_1270677 [Mycena vulgaris]|nr:hypothetical protein DFH09DRAFT_1270677 [Mycena vulgaris]
MVFTNIQRPMTTTLALPAESVPPAVTRGLIEELDSQIAALKCSIRKLKRERETLTADLDGYIYPVLTLPHEITSEIFLQSFHQSPMRDTPLFLGHLCRTWREIALATPALWTDIALHLEDVAAREPQLCFLKTVLSRSGDCPLYVHIRCDVRASRGHTSVREFIDAIAPHFRRCKTLTLVLPFSDILLIPSELPATRTLAIGISELHKDAGRIDPSWPLKAFHGPKLTILSLTVFSPKLLLLPWAQITSVSLMMVPVFPDLLEILRAAVNLADLTAEITCPCTDENMADIPDIPPLLHLHTLELTAASNPTGCVQLLDKLTLPALCDLNIPEPCFLPTPTDIIHAFLARWGCCLLSLRVKVVDAEFSRSHYGRAWLDVGKIVVRAPEFEDDSDLEGDLSIWDSEDCEDTSSKWETDASSDEDGHN